MQLHLSTRPDVRKSQITLLCAALLLTGCGSLGNLSLVSVEAKKLPTSGGEPEMDIVGRYNSTVDLSGKDRITLFGTLWLCDRPDAHVRLGPLDLKYERRLAPIVAPEKMGPPPYSVVFRVAFTEPAAPSDIPQFEVFDLRADPQNICFQLQEGPYATLGAQSDVLTIPEEKISDAIRDATRNAPSPAR